MEVIIETEFNGKTFRELSRLWDVPLGTLLARKHRGVTAITNEAEGKRRLKLPAHETGGQAV